MADSKNIRKCPRKGCNNEAIIHHVYGVIPCKNCQKREESISIRERYSASHLGKLHRIQEQRDRFEKDMLQPYKGHKANPEFFKAYPDKVDVYGVREELGKI